MSLLGRDSHQHPNQNGSSSNGPPDSVDNPRQRSPAKVRLGAGPPGSDPGPPPPDPPRDQPTKPGATNKGEPPSSQKSAAEPCVKIRHVSTGIEVHAAATR
eukprot:gene30362-35367_t